MLPLLLSKIFNLWNNLNLETFKWNVVLDPSIMFQWRHVLNLFPLTFIFYGLVYTELLPLLSKYLIWLWKWQWMVRGGRWYISQMSLKSGKWNSKWGEIRNNRVAEPESGCCHIANKWKETLIMIGFEENRG